MSAERLKIIKVLLLSRGGPRISNGMGCWLKRTPSFVSGGGATGVMDTHSFAATYQRGTKMHHGSANTHIILGEG